MFKENKFFRLMLLGAIVLSLAAAGCATRKAMWGDAQTGFILNYDIPQNTTLKYKNSAKTNQKIDMMGQTMETTTETDLEYSIDGTRIDDKNNLVTRVGIDNLRININSMQGANTPDTSALAGKSFGLSVSRKGKELEYTGLDDVPKYDLGQMGGGMQGVNSFFLDVFPDLPDKPVKPGETWITTIDQKTEQGPIEIATIGEAINTLEGVETIDGMECAKITTKGTSTLEGSGDMMGNEIEITGMVDAVTTWYFAFEKGTFIKSSSEENTIMKMELGAMGEMPIVSQTNREIELEL